MKITISEGWIREDSRKASESFYSNYDSRRLLSERLDNWIDSLKFDPEKGRLKVTVEYTEN